MNILIEFKGNKNEILWVCFSIIMSLNSFHIWDIYFSNSHINEESNWERNHLPATKKKLSKIRINIERQGHKTREILNNFKSSTNNIRNV
jgi:hypothetical protein